MFKQYFAVQWNERVNGGKRQMFKKEPFSTADEAHAWAAIWLVKNGKPLHYLLIRGEEYVR
jgi:hypothetical protein